MSIKKLLIVKGSGVSGNMTFSTAGSQIIPNLVASSSLDAGTQDAFPTNTTFINNLLALNLNMFSFVGGGSTMAWNNYYTIPTSRTDGYHTSDTIALMRGKDPTTLLSGRFNDSYGGRDFFIEYLQAMPEIGSPNAVLGVNLLEPLAPYTTYNNANAVVDYSTVDIGGIINQLDFAIDNLQAIGINVKIVELCLEQQIDANYDVIVHNSGKTGVDVYTTILQTTNATSTITILQYLRAKLPNAILSADGFLWDDKTITFPNWILETGKMDIDVIRQYYQFGEKNSPVTDYPSARNRIALYPQFFDFINSSDYNGKGCYISQVAIKDTTGINNNVGMGLTFAELYMTLSKENANNGNKLVGICQQHVRDLFVSNTYNPYAQFYYFKQLGALFTGENVTLITDTAQNINLITCPIQYGSSFKIGVLNFNAFTVSYNGLTVDGVQKPFSSFQYYSTDGTATGTTVSNATQTTGLNFFPYSFSVISC